MAYDVKLLSLAENDLYEICEYLSQFYSNTVRKFLDEFDKCINNVSANPKMYPKYEFDEKYRRIICGDYLIFYQTNEKNKLVKVYRILHGKRNVSAILQQ